MAANRFEELYVWQHARVVNKDLFSHFKRCSEPYLRNQILRASLSIMSNIAEGFDRRYSGDFVRFLAISRGSAAEVRSQLYSAFDQGLITSEKQIAFYNRLNLISTMLAKLSDKVVQYPPSKSKNISKTVASDNPTPYSPAQNLHMIDRLIEEANIEEPLDL